ncbi:MAG: aminodeoxychorismate synthase component I [Pseudomonadota bacterium]
MVAIADAIDLVALHQRSPDRYPFLLQSTAVSRQLGGYDILFACPRERFELRELGDLDSQGGFLKTLDDRWRAEYADVDTETMPFTGGWFLYLGYELAGEIEPGLTLTPDPLLPVAFAVRCKAAVIRRHSDQACFLISEKDADVCATTVSEDIAAAVNFEYSGLPDVSPTITEEEPTIFTDAVVSAKEHISAGDIYQANLSRQWMARFADPVEPESVYRSLCTQNPGPFAGLISYDDVHVVSSSPERLLAVTGRHISTRPIAGTRPRSDNAEHDQELLEELINNPKERAEHVMLIDLERNDLGRVCEAGTVVVNENMVIESYAHVHHIVSNVEGQLRADITPGQAIAAVFPGGTITGCPKVRCMEIISELEDSPRGAYTGSFGYLNRNGDLDLNILIRTLVIHDDEVTLRAGSGIVADSEPEAELNETRAKAKGLLRALSP